MKYRSSTSTFTIKVVFHVTDNSAVPIMTDKQKEDILDNNPNAKFVEESAIFARWNYDIKTRIEMESTTVDQNTQLHFISPAKKRQLKIKYLLRDWSLTDDNEEHSKIEILLDPITKCMTDTCYNNIVCGPNHINPIILDAFVIRADYVFEYGMSEEEANSTNPKI